MAKGLELHRNFMDIWERKSDQQRKMSIIQRNGNQENSKKKKFQGENQ